jgi:hypothetical protein
MGRVTVECDHLGLEAVEDGLEQDVFREMRERLAASPVVGVTNALAHRDRDLACGRLRDDDDAEAIRELRAIDPQVDPSNSARPTTFTPNEYRKLPSGSTERSDRTR